MEDMVRTFCGNTFRANSSQLCQPYAYVSLLNLPEITFDSSVDVGYVSYYNLINGRWYYEEMKNKNVREV